MTIALPCIHSAIIYIPNVLVEIIALIHTIGFWHGLEADGYYSYLKVAKSHTVNSVTFWVKSESKQSQILTHSSIS